jgi:hypothetical protein
MFFEEQNSTTILEALWAVMDYKGDYKMPNMF